MANKNLNIYKGVIIAVTPHKGYAFIKPLWQKEGDKPLFCHYNNGREKARKTCFIKILGGGKKFPYSITKNIWGEEVYVPKKTQEVYFKIAVQKTANKGALMCYDLCDHKHISAEEAEEASKGSQKEPNWEELDLPVVAENGDELNEYDKVGSKLYSGDDEAHSHDEESDDEDDKDLDDEDIDRDEDEDSDDDYDDEDDDESTEDSYDDDDSSDYVNDDSDNLFDEDDYNDTMDEYEDLYED